jgi:steroid delta-isomerase-like uncharacterized protein
MRYEDLANTINRHDWDAITSFMTDDVSYEDVTLGEHASGKEQVRRLWSRTTTELSSDFQLVPLRVIATENDYAGEWMLKGTHDCSTEQLQATGRRFAIHGVSIGTLQGGLIKANKDFWNLAEFLGQVGLMPQIVSQATARSHV